MTSDFDREAFLEWLDDRDGPIDVYELADEWPDFPIERLKGSTGPIVDGKFCYYQHDLQKVAEGRAIID